MGRSFSALAFASLVTASALAQTPDETTPEATPAATTTPSAIPTATPSAIPTATPTATPSATTPAATTAPTATPPAIAREPSQVNAARVSLGLSYFRGSKLAGVGTRKVYEGGDASLYLDLIRFPLRWFGFEIAMEAGMGTVEAIPLIFGLRSAADFALIRWSGRASGSFIVGAGSGFEVGGDRTWINESVRAYPLLLTRLRVFPTSGVGLSASWQFVPITTSLRLDARILLQTHEIEAAMSYHYLQFGARACLSAATGGDPRRTYNEARFGPFFGAVFY